MRQNKFLTRLRKLKDLLMTTCDGMSMDNPCGGSDLTIDNVLTDLDECITHCAVDVDYTPPDLQKGDTQRSYQNNAQ